MLPSTLALSSPTLPLLQKPHFLAVSLRTFSKSHICFAFSPPNGEEVRWLAEEQRWLREEQRWLREEQRWLREESRWNAERQTLLQQITTLELRIQELQRLNSSQGSEIVANIAKLLQVLKDGDLGKNINRIADSGRSVVPFVVEAAKMEEEEEVIVKEVTSIPDKKRTVKKRETLRTGSYGDEVQAMQEALLKLGFYSGEEDIGFSYFSSDTERAVKTWQATLGLLEDGIMTVDLLERLFGTNNQETDPEKRANGAPIASIADVQQTIVTKESEVSHHRVFLLGENWWEEPSRLSGGNRSKGIVGKGTNKCISCRGEGRVMCMECDGTGEPNIEPQFTEWVDEGAKCPYCEGLGFTTCDVCGEIPVTHS